MKTRLIVAIFVGFVLAGGGVALAQTQWFTDVPSGHSQSDAINWAAEVGLTTGYDDGTFRPEMPLSRWHAVTFIERFYDNVLETDEPDRFSRGDMMALLHTIHTGNTAGLPDWHWLYGQKATVLEPGLYRFMAYLRHDENGDPSPVRITHLGGGEHHYFYEDGVVFKELGCYDLSRVSSPTQTMHWVVSSRSDDFIYFQRLMDCPPEFQVPTS